MKKCKVTLRPSMPAYPSLEVDAYETDTPGLVVHRVHNIMTGTPLPRWGITHSPSGQRIGADHPTRKAALAVVGLARTLPVDWAADSGAVQRQVSDLPLEDFLRFKKAALRFK